MKKIIGILVSVVVIFFVINIYEMTREPAELEITIGETKIPYVLGVNKWNGAMCDREDTFVTYSRRYDEFSKVAINSTIDIKFLDRKPYKVQISEYHLNEGDILVKETSKSEVKFSRNWKRISFLINESDVQENIKGDELRGYRITCSWGMNKCEYAFLLWVTGEDEEKNLETSVDAKVQLYEGTYFDNILFSFNINPDSFKPYCEIVFSNITSTSFDFTINEIINSAGDTEILLPKNTAIFIGDGTKAVCYADEYTLSFTFPDYHKALPVVTDVEISGLDKLEGNTYTNNGIPGHEFN